MPRRTGGKDRRPAANVAGAGRGRRKTLRNAKGRSTSSARWLSRQLRDPYVAAARRQGYRSRAAFKLIELDDRFRFLRRGAAVVDLGAAPGGWSQVAAVRVKAGHNKGGRVVAVDREAMEAIPAVIHVTTDFLDADAPSVIRTAIGCPADVVLSDMAAPATGHAKTDHLRIMALLEAAHEFARDVLAPGGAFVGKVLRGGTEQALLTALKRDFREVRHVKPPSSRKDSAEIYVVAMGYRGHAGEGKKSAAKG